MNYLLDTHCLIWFQEANPKLPERIIKIIQSPANIVYFSQLSLYEIAIKQKIGKLPLFLASVTEVYEQAVKDNFTFMPIENRHIEAYATIPLANEHRDPFDRLLIAAAYSESLAIISGDRNFLLYSEWVKVEWNAE